MSGLTTQHFSFSYCRSYQQFVPQITTLNHSASVSAEALTLVPFGQRWNSHQCKCISNCAGVNCPSNKKCQPVNGECVCIAVQPTSCPSGQRWDENQCRCVIIDLCAGEPCPGPNYVCNPATGACLCIAPCGPNQIRNLDCECVGDDGFIN